jgi:hypothetical protein
MCTVLAVPALAACLFTAPETCDHVKGEGEVVKKQLTVDAFHGIRVESAMNVVLTPAATQAVEVEAQANIAELVTTEVKNGIWIIATSKDYSTTKPFIVHISAPLIDVVRVEGSGDVKSEGSFTASDVELTIEGSGNLTYACAARSVRIEVDGSGNVQLSGTTTRLKTSVQGSGDVMAADMKASEATVDLQGSGDAAISASESVDASVQGSGDVVYSGKPARVNRNVSGSGEVRPAGGYGPL